MEIYECPTCKYRVSEIVIFSATIDLPCPRCKRNLFSQFKKLKSKDAKEIPTEMEPKER